MLNKKNILVLFVSTAISLALAEMVLRAVSPKAANFNHHQLYCEHDTLLGWRKIPNATGHHKTPEYEVWERINSKGIRGPEYRLEKDSGEFRIAILGDSFAEGYTVGFDSLFSEVLKKKLQAAWPEKQVEVINFGTGGYSTDQELLCFERDVVQYSPDATVLLFCVNDPWFNNQSRYYDRGFKPLFVMDGDSLRLTNVPVPALATRSFFSKAKDWLLRSFELVRRMNQLADKINSAGGGQSVPVEWRIYQTEKTAEMEAAWQVTARILKRLNERVTAAGSSLAVFYVVEKMEVGDSEWQSFLESYALDGVKFDSAMPADRLAASCDSLGIPLINAVETFKTAAESNPLFFEKDWHWNAGGNKVAGEVLTGYFLESNLKFINKTATNPKAR